MLQSPQPLRIAVVGGSGLIGKRHCQHVAKHPSCHLIAIVDPSPDAVAIAEHYSTKRYSTIAALLDSPEKPDAAIVATPNSSHVPLSGQLVEAGVHVLCEKPISTTLESARELIDTAKKYDVKLLIGHHRRFNPYIVATKRIVDSGRLGHITAVSGLWTTFKPSEYFSPEAVKWRRTKEGGGVVLINFIHEIDLMHYLFGPVKTIHAERTVSRRPAATHTAEEGAAIVLRFASGVVGTFIVSDNVVSPHSFEQGTGENPMLPKSGSDAYRILGTEGTLSFPDMVLSSYKSASKSWESVIDRESVPVDGLDVPPFDLQLDHFVKVCRGQEEPSCSGEEGLRALEVCEALRDVIDGPENGGSRTFRL